MRTIYSEDHRLHFPQAELSPGGQFVTPYERPSRVEYVLNRLRERKLTDIAAPDAVDMASVRALLDPGYLTFLQTAWDEWKAEGMAGEVIAANVPTRGMHMDRILKNIDGKVGYYCHASETPSPKGLGRQHLLRLLVRRPHSGMSRQLLIAHSRFAVLPVTMPLRINMAGIALSIKRRLLRRCSARQGQSVSLFWTSTFTTEMARNRCFMTVPTCAA